MAIELFTGTPGSGKSYNALKRIVFNLRIGRIVIANFPIKFTPRMLKKGYDKRFYYMTNEEITVENLVVFAIEKGMIDKHKESQCLVVIDEAGGRFNCREYAKSDRAEWIDFFSQHRKLGFTFVLVAQNDKMIDKQIRGFIEYEVKHRKLNRFGALIFLPVTIFVAVEYWYTVKAKTSSDFILFRRSVGDLYDHMGLFKGFKMSEALIKKIEEKREGLEVDTSTLGLDNTPISAIFNEKGSGSGEE